MWCSRWSTATTSRTAAPRTSPRRFGASSIIARRFASRPWSETFKASATTCASSCQEGRPDVFAHNVEVVPRLQRSIRDVRCSWERSVDALVTAKELGASVVKTSLMVGLGEERDEVLSAMQLLRDADVDVLTIGQYLRPTKRHASVQRYVEPAEFEDYEKQGLEMGFRFVASGPLVRSSYRAAEVFLAGALARSGAGRIGACDESLREETKARRARLRGTCRSFGTTEASTQKLDPGLSIDEVVALYKAMVRTRIIDDRLERIQRQGRIAFHVGSLGEEAAIVGAAAALRDRDWIVPCYREVGALLWRGYPVQRYVDHMFGNADDPVRGRQMPDHTFSRAHRYLAVSAPIGTQIPTCRRSGDGGQKARPR